MSIVHSIVTCVAARCVQHQELRGWGWGNGPHLVSQAVKTMHQCLFLGHAIVNVLSVQLVHPAVNITSRKNEFFNDIKHYH